MNRELFHELHDEEYRRQEIEDRLFLESEDRKYGNPYRCETCAWYRYSEVDDEFVCVNRRSDYCAEQMGDYDSCKEWEGKKR